jgi:cobalamin biosynthesis protein CobD/CbiB
MKSRVVTAASTFLFILLTGIFTSTQTFAAKAIDKGNSVEFKGLTKSDVTNVRRGLNATVSRTVNDLSNGVVNRVYPD